MGPWYAKNRLLVNTGIMAYILAFFGVACDKKPETRKRPDVAATEAPSGSDGDDAKPEGGTSQDNPSQDKKKPKPPATTSQEDSDEKPTIAKSPPRKDKETRGQSDPDSTSSDSSTESDRSSGSTPASKTPESQPGSATKPPVSSKTPGTTDVPKTLDTDIMFSINMMTKLCQDLQSREFRDLGTKILANKNNSLKDFANKDEFANLTLAELEIMKSVLVKLDSNLVDEFEEVLCDDFDGSGKIYKYDVLINKIKNQ